MTTDVRTAATRDEAREVHLERLLGRKVLDPAGKSAGRIEEIEAERSGGECVITAYLLGRRGLLERLSIADVSMAFTRLLGAEKFRSSHRVPWDQMDLSDPDHPRLRCTVDQLEKIGAAAGGR